MRVTSKGQVTIPIHVREALGIDSHMEVEFELEGDHAILKPAEDRKSRARRMVESIQGTSTVKMTTDEIMALTRGE